MALDIESTMSGTRFPTDLARPADKVVVHRASAVALSGRDGAESAHARQPVLFLFSMQAPTWQGVPATSFAPVTTTASLTGANAEALPRQGTLMDIPSLDLIPTMNCLDDIEILEMPTPVPEWEGGKEDGPCRWLVDRIPKLIRDRDPVIPPARPEVVIDRVMSLLMLNFACRHEAYQ